MIIVLLTAVVATQQPADTVVSTRALEITGMKRSDFDGMEGRLRDEMERAREFLEV